MPWSCSYPRSRRPWPSSCRESGGWTTSSISSNQACPCRPNPPSTCPRTISSTRGRRPISQYTAPGGQTIILAPQEAKQWEAYLGRKAIFEARVEAAYQARRIALTFLGLAFAGLGASAGHALSDRSTTADASPGAGPSTMPG